MTSLAVEIKEILEAEAREALAAGWAEVREEEAEIGLTLHLEPMKISSAPLEVYFDSDQLLVCSPGRKDMVCEFFSEDPEEIKRQGKALTAAGVGGSYAERLQEATTEIVGEWPGPEGRQKATRSLLAMRPPGNDGWRAIDYEAY